MNDCMTQEDAMNMNNEQAIQILKPMQKMMIDQHGCPVSDAYFALGKAIESLKTNADVRENVKGNWIKRIDNLDYGLIEFEGFECSLCGVKIWKDDYENIEFNFCPNCGADMRSKS